MRKTINLPYFDTNIEVTGIIINSKNKRRYVLMKNVSSGDKTSITYAKYILSLYLGRQISSDEIVDHYDLNPFNDSLFNLRIVDAETSLREDSIRAKKVELECITCKVKILRDSSKTRGGKAGPFCKKCATTYSRAVVLGRIEKLPPQPFIKPELYRIQKAPNNSIQNIELAKELDLLLVKIEEELKDLPSIELKKKQEKDLEKAKKIAERVDKDSATHYPHFDPDCYGVTLHFNKDRRFIRIKNTKTKAVKNTAYARYLMEQSLGRYLAKDEFVDHINRDHTDDRLENLQVISSRASGILDTKRLKDIEITCAFCQKKVIRRFLEVKRAVKLGAKQVFCSAGHASIYRCLDDTDTRKQIPNFILPEPEYYFIDKQKFKDGIEEAESEFIDYYEKTNG